MKTIRLGAGSGGAVTVSTCKEQLLYEIGDPENYYQPDVIADFSRVRIEEIAPDRVRVSGGEGKPAPETLKVSVGYRDGYIGEGQMSYAGPGALQRARLAGEIVRERLALIGAPVEDLRIDLIGVDSMHGAAAPEPRAEPNEVRLRVAGRAQSLAAAALIGLEVETLYTNGPAGGGGAFKNARPIIAIGSAYLPRGVFRTQVAMTEVA